MIVEPTPQAMDPSPGADDVVLSVKGVSKKFCRSLKRSLLYGIQDIGSELLGLRENCDRLRPKEFWALKDVSLQLRRGEALGLVGANGSGKTTLLRIISGLIRPDTGSIQIRGRVAPLIALGAGFNPILTGRENIYANMSILGLSTKEIDQRFDEVVDFAEIGEAIESPVHTYSSGMAARLGFACAVHTNPDILLIDEVLVVGDIKFKIKCYKRLHQLRQQGVSFIVVSHASSTISTLCKEAFYIRKGEKVACGDTIPVLRQYEEDLLLNGAHESTGIIHIPARNNIDTTGLDVTSLFFRNFSGEVIQTPISGQPICLCVLCQIHKPLDQVSLMVDVKSMSNEGETILYMNSMDDDAYLSVSPGKHEIQVQMPHLSLGLGLYNAIISVRSHKAILLDRVESFKFSVRKPDNQSTASLIYQMREWKLVD